MGRGRTSGASAGAREAGLRREVVDCYRAMVACGLTRGTSGNVSVRLGEALLITPSGVAPEALEPNMLAVIALDSTDGASTGPLAPSTEWRFHRDILRCRPDVGAVIHAHSTYATALAMARRAIPPCHYMIAAFGGDTVPCTGYALFGSQMLSDLAVAALRDRHGCLLANHGMITVGATLERAMWRAVELETLARQYCVSLAAGGPVLLSPQEIEEACAAFAAYGQRERAAPEPGRPTRKSSARR